MGIITHPDQMARTREFEKESVMFPRGPHQMLAYCYAMEGVPAYNKSVHARMIEMAETGEIERFDDKGVNLSGMTTIEKRGECAGIRAKVEEILDYHESCFIHAKFGAASIPTTRKGLVCFAKMAQEELASGRFRAQRSLAYIGDVVQLAIRPNHNPEQCTVMGISAKHQASQNMVSRDMSLIKGVVRPIEDAAFRKVLAAFSDGVVLKSA